MDIGVISPFLNIKELQTNNEKKNTGFLNFFLCEINNNSESEERPSLNIKDLVNKLTSDEVKNEKTQEKNNNDNVFVELASLYFSDFKAMSLIDENKDSKWNSKNNIIEGNDKKIALTEQKTNWVGQKDLLILLSSIKNLNEIFSQFQNVTDSLKSENNNSLYSNLQNLTNNIILDTTSNNTKSNQIPINLLKSLTSSDQFTISEIIQNIKEINNIDESISNTDFNSILDKLGIKISELTELNENTIKIDLQPPELGKIIINFNSQKNSAEVQVISSYEQVKSMIESNISQINEALKNKLVDIKNLNIKQVEISTENTNKIPEDTDIDSNELITDFVRKSTQAEKTPQTSAVSSNNYKEFFTLLGKKNYEEKLNTTQTENYTFSPEFKLERSNDLVKIDTDNNLPAQKIIDSVIGKVKQLFTENKSQIEIKLIPENLGKLTVKIISEEGKLSANIEVKNIEVKHVIESGIQRIRENLGQNGIHIDQINVSLSDDNYKQNHHQNFFTKKQNEIITDDSINFEDETTTESMKTLGYNTLEYIV